MTRMAAQRQAPSRDQASETISRPISHRIDFSSQLAPGDEAICDDRPPYPRPVIRRTGAQPFAHAAKRRAKCIEIVFPAKVTMLLVSERALGGKRSDRKLTPKSVVC